MRNLSVSCRVNQLFFAIILMWYTRYIYIYFSSTEHCAWVIISPKEFKYCVTRKSFALLYWKTELSDVKYFAILVKIKWHIKWKYLIKKFHDICLSYYFNITEDASKILFCSLVSSRLDYGNPLLYGVNTMYQHNLEVTACSK